MSEDVDRNGPSGPGPHALSGPRPPEEPELLGVLLAIGRRAFRARLAFVCALDDNTYEILACDGVDVASVRRDPSFCRIMARGEGPIVVADASLQPELRSLELVTQALGIRFCAGVPLRDRSETVGALCFADTKPRPGLGDEELALLADLGRAASDVLRLRRRHQAISGELAERDAIERRLRTNERRTRLIIHESGEGFITIDGDSRIQEWNRRAEQIFGWAREEAIGEKLTDTIIPPRFRDAHLAGMERFMATGEGAVLFRPMEVSALHRDGHEFPVEINVWPVQVGEESTFHAFVRDITERKETEAAYKHAKEAAEAADRAKSEFLSRMSHELRTPLNAILGFSQLLEMDDLSEEQLDSLAEIRKGGRHLLNLINEVLDIARIESGRLSLSMEPVYLLDVVRQAVGLMRSLAAGAGVSIETDEVSLRRFVSGDHQRLDQVLLNLLSNAVKYNQAGGSVLVQAREDHEGLVHLDVIDTGRGITPGQLERLFTPFERLGAEQTTVEGSGLGLALSRTLVEAMGGELSATRRAEGGMVFTVALAPASSQLAGLDIDSAEPDELPVLKLSARHTILCVEDNLSNLKLIEQTLGRDADIQLLTAIQGGMGLHLAREHRPDLILLDLHLPDMPGADVLRRLMMDERTRDIPVIVVSADATDGQVRRLLDAGARAFVTKPLDLAELRRTVERLLSSPALEGANEGRHDDAPSP